MFKTIITLALLTLLSCKKEDDKASVALPPALSQVFNSYTDCGECPYNISLIVLREESYYLVELAPEAVLCDAIVGAVIYDKEKNMIEINSPLYFEILNEGSNRGIVYSCKNQD